jgi:hypothetical protein
LGHPFDFETVHKAFQGALATASAVVAGNHRSLDAFGQDAQTHTEQNIRDGLTRLLEEFLESLPLGKLPL